MEDNSWPKVQLQEVCEHITVGHVGPMAHQYTATGIPFLRSQNVRPFRFDPTEIKYIFPDFHTALRKSALRPNDVVVTRSGANTGQCCIIPPQLKDANCADLVILRPSERINPWFLMYVLNSDWGRATIAGGVVGAAQHHFNIGTARQFAIALPPLSVQRRIAGILSAYDDLIENNQRRIKILEEMARSLYREWFVHFRFPGHEKVKMVLSPLGPIPQGWEVKPLNDVVEDIIDYRGRTPTKLKGEWASEGILALSALNVKGGRLVNLEKSKLVSEELYGRWMKTPLKSGDILMTSEAPLGELFFLCKEERYCLSQRLYSIRANHRVMAPVILYLCLESEQTQHELSSRASGATVSGIRQAELRKVPILVPGADVQMRAEPFLQRLAEQICTLDIQIQNLRRTRDLLLPRLLSGQIELKSMDAVA